MESHFFSVHHALNILSGLHAKYLRRADDDVAVGMMQEHIEATIDILDELASDSRGTKRVNLVYQHVSMWLAYDAEREACDIETAELACRKKPKGMTELYNLPGRQGSTPATRATDYLARLRGSREGTQCDN